MATTLGTGIEVATSDRIAIVKLLVRGMALGLVVKANPHLDDELIRRVADDHGYPSVAKLERALTQLESGQAPSLTATTVVEPTVTAPRADHQPEQRSGLYDVRVEDLQPSPNNPRERMTDIPDLAASIREAGLIQPIVAQRLDDGETLQIVAGHRRHAAVKMLGWEKVPCIIRKTMRPDAELVTMLIENGQRAGLDPIEEARALNHLKVTHHLTDRQVATKVGRTQPHVSGRLALLSLSWEEQEQIRNGQLMITEGTRLGREASGKVKPGAIGKRGPAHLAAHHPLAAQAKARCIRLKHSRGRGTSVGATACGECWESVIRADERQHLHQVSATNGACGLCGGKYGTE
jgi:ParB family transcriptional regulator, chromosome partitioning protein